MEKEKESKIYKIAIQDNNLSKATICPICEAEFEPNIGPQSFLAGTWDPVCWPCSNKYISPHLRLGQLTAHHAFKLIKSMEEEKTKTDPEDVELPF